MRLGIAIIFVGLLALAGCSGEPSQKQAEQTAKLEARLAYLNDIDEVDRFSIIDGNSVVAYFSIRPMPNRLQTIVNGAAFAGNKEIDFGVHVWAVRSDYTGDLPPDRYICTATARYGEVQKSNC